MKPPLTLATLLALAFPGVCPAADPIRLANAPALSPDGSTLAFAWAGEIWAVPSEGGMAKPLTRNPARDASPKFSPDGKEIAFVSDRDGSNQVYVMGSDGEGPPRQVTHHTAGFGIDGYYPDGQSLLLTGRRDHHWYAGQAGRFFKVKKDERAAEELVFDDYGSEGALSPDGKTLLFVREASSPWWRKGYKGSEAGQIWSYETATKAFKKILETEGGALWPMWKPDGKGFYYVAMNEGAFNLWDYDLAAEKGKPLTAMKDDSVVFPAISKDGSTIVFRHLFDLYRYRPGKDEAPQKIAVTHGGDGAPDPIDRRTLTSADEVAFSKDGLEIAFIAGGDLWVMDTELMEPTQVTNTPEEERDPAFSPDGDALLVVSDEGGQSDLYRIERGDANTFWWRNGTFKKEKITNDADVEAQVKFSPDGSKLAYVKGRGDLVVADAKGKDAKVIVPGWDRPEYDWSPDGKWLTYAQADNDFNVDIYVVPSDGSRPPVNVSRHPDVDSNPVWSPDGKAIAFTGRRGDNEVDIYYVYLTKDDDEKQTRDRTIEKAIEKITKARAKKGAGKKAEGDAKGEEPKKDGEAEKKDAEKKDGDKKAPPKVAIDFGRIHERIKQVAIPNATEGALFWSPDSKKLAFSSTIDGRTGLFTIEPPDDLKPKPLGNAPVSGASWLEQGNQIVGLVNGSPASVPGGGGGAGGPAAGAGRGGAGASASTPPGATPPGGDGIYRFRARQEVNTPAKYRAAFEMAWRAMRDGFYDERLGNRNWDAIRRKYADAAAEAPDPEGLATVVNLMLGELNGSHLGFTATGGRALTRPTPGAGPAAASGKWNVVTPYLGLRFDPEYKGPGLKVKSVVPDSPADLKRSKIEPGEVVASVDGSVVDPSMDLTKVLNGPIERDIKLLVKDKDGKERAVTIRPVPYAALGTLLYEEFIKDERKKVDEASKGTLGYLHIRGMDFPSFHRFEQELYAVGAGKDGLIIDVRNNGGGSTTDHLLTALTQPVHAIAVPRGGGPGYPQDRMIYATWNKPIVVLCNQNSFSNAEIFSHAIKTLKRGQLVGAPTAGGVISTGGTAIMDVGFLRMPFRGWYTLNDGEDMELHGAVPDHVVWPEPGDSAAGKDVQLSKAVEVLLKDVDAYKAKPRPKLKKATER